MAILPVNIPNLEDLEVGTITWPQIINSNLAFIDERLTIRDVIASRPAFGATPVDVMFYSTDTNELFWNSGTAWVLVANGGVTGPTPTIVTDTTLFATTSATFVDITSMIQVLATVGDYVIHGSCELEPGLGNTIGEVALAVGPTGGPFTPVAHTHRRVGGNAGPFSAHTQHLILGATALDEVHFQVRRDAGTGSVNINERSLLIERK